MFVFKFIPWFCIKSSICLFLYYLVNKTAHGFSKFAFSELYYRISVRLIPV